MYTQNYSNNLTPVWVNTKLRKSPKGGIEGEGEKKGDLKAKQLGKKKRGHSSLENVFDFFQDIHKDASAPRTQTTTHRDFTNLLPHEIHVIWIMTLTRFTALLLVPIYTLSGKGFYVY